MSGANWWANLPPEKAKGRKPPRHHEEARAQLVDPVVCGSRWYKAKAVQGLIYEGWPSSVLDVARALVVRFREQNVCLILDMTDEWVRITFPPYDPELLMHPLHRDIIRAMVDEVAQQKGVEVWQTDSIFGVSFRTLE